MFLDHRIGFKRGSCGDAGAVAESAASAQRLTNGALSCHRRRSMAAPEESRLMYRNGGGITKAMHEQVRLNEQKGEGAAVGGLRESVSVRDPREMAAS